MKYEKRKEHFMANRKIRKKNVPNSIQYQNSLLRLFTFSGIIFFICLQVIKRQDVSQISRKRSHSVHATDDLSPPPLQKSLTSPRGRSDWTASSPGQAALKLQVDSQSFSQSASFSSDSQSVNIFSQSQSQSQASSRKLPAWMSSSGNKTVFKKKMKSNSLFK